jgi:hypothetical protein
MAEIRNGGKNFNLRFGGKKSAIEIDRRFGGKKSEIEIDSSIIWREEISKRHIDDDGRRTTDDDNDNDTKKAHE